MINININSFTSDFQQWLPGFAAWPSALKRQLEIRLDNCAYRFSDNLDLSFALGGRTAVPVNRINELYHLSDNDLEHELCRLAAFEQQLAEIRDDHVAHGLSLRLVLQQTGTRMISNDHEWRQIFDQLIEHARIDEKFLLTAVNCYLRYLAERRDNIGSIRLLKENACNSGPELATCRVASLPASANLPHKLKIPVLQRLVKGCPTTLALTPGETLEIRVAQHAYTLVHDSAWALIADSGERYRLQPGHNSVGRSRNNHIVLNSSLKNISRQHFLAVPGDERAITLTDTSSAGTFVPATALVV